MPSLGFTLGSPLGVLAVAGHAYAGAVQAAGSVGPTAEHGAGRELAAWVTGTGSVGPTAEHGAGYKGAIAVQASGTLGPTAEHGAGRELAAWVTGTASVGPVKAGMAAHTYAPAQTATGALGATKAHGAGYKAATAVSGTGTLGPAPAHGAGRELAAWVTGTASVGAVHAAMWRSGTATLLVNTHTPVVTGWVNPQNAYSSTDGGACATATPAANSTISGDFTAPMTSIPANAVLRVVRVELSWGAGAYDTFTLGVQPRVNNADTGSELTRSTG